ncbi:MAG: hypothetical protein WCJ55_04590 [Chloroflexales bacterium]
MSTYFEQIDRSAQREEEWRLLDIALLQRRNHIFHRSIIATIFWILSARP